MTVRHRHLDHGRDSFPRTALHRHARARQRRDRGQRWRPARGHQVPLRTHAGRQGAAGPQGRARRSGGGRCGAALQRRHRPRCARHPRRQLGARAPARDAGGTLARRPADLDGQGGDRCLRSRATPSRATATPTARSAPATSWPSRPRCSAWPASSSSRSSASGSELLPKYPNVDDVVGLEHTYGCGVAIDAPDAIIPIRTLRNITLNPNFGNEVMVVSLGCEKLQPERLLPPGTFAIVDERNVADVGTSEDAKLDVVCLQDDAHVGFMSMIDSIMATAEAHLERLNARRRETVPGERTRRRRAVRRQRCLQRRHRQPGGRLLHRPAGARGRDGHVLRNHRSARRHRPADRRAPRAPKSPTR